MNFHQSGCIACENWDFNCLMACGFTRTVPDSFEVNSGSVDST